MFHETPCAQEETLNAEELLRAAQRAKAYLLKRTRTHSEVDIDNVIGETILAAWQFRHRFDGVSKLSSWVIGISWNHYLLSIRRLKNKEFVPADVLDIMADPKPNPERRLLQKERRQILASEIIRLPEEMMHASLQLASGQIADSGKEKSRRYRARHRLRHVLNKYPNFTRQP